MVVQVNGKVRDRIEVDAEIDEDEATQVGARFGAGHREPRPARNPRG